MNRGDGQVGKLGIRVGLGDGRIVPVLDFALEDLGYYVRIQVQLLDALDVEDDGYRGNVGGQIESIGATAVLGLLYFVALEVSLGTGPRYLLANELFNASARANCTVGDLGIGVVFHEGLSPGGHCRLL